jgi:membrane protease YdiL (CAAX protease family)
MGGIGLVLLLRDPAFDRRSLWRSDRIRPELRSILLLVGLSTLLLVAALALLVPDHLFYFPRRLPGQWLLILVLYPLLSVYPQELLWRAVIFHRYLPLLPTAALRVAGSAALFGYVHIIFANWVAVILTLIGGVLFGIRYERTRSLAIVWLEHSLYGQVLFTVGLGQYFYHANVLTR